MSSDGADAARAGAAEAGKQAGGPEHRAKPGGRSAGEEAHAREGVLVDGGGAGAAAPEAGGEAGVEAKEAPATGPPRVVSYSKEVTLEMFCPGLAMEGPKPDGAPWAVADIQSLEGTCWRYAMDYSPGYGWTPKEGYWVQEVKIKLKGDEEFSLQFASFLAPGAKRKFKRELKSYTLKRHLDFLRSLPRDSTGGEPVERKGPLDGWLQDKRRDPNHFNLLEDPPAGLEGSESGVPSVERGKRFQPSSRRFSFQQRERVSAWRSQRVE
jgi:hypothetical protein